jgi:hypothetical protein
MSAAQQVSCLKVAAGRSLYIAVYAPAQGPGWEVSQIKKELIERYRPISNVESIDVVVETRYRLVSLEKQISELDGVLKLALAAIAQTSPVREEPKKRVVGFRPDPAGSRRGSPGKA